MIYKLTSLSSNITCSRSIARIWLTAALLALLTVSTGANAQQSADDAESLAQQQEVSALLAEIDEQNKTRLIYSEDQKVEISEVPFSSRFSVVRTGPQWTIIRFEEPTVPGWVSLDYVDIKRGRATVNAEALNVRSQPSIDSPIVSRVFKGYESLLSGRQDGFVRIVLPAELAVAIKADSSNQEAADTNSSKKPWEVTGNAQEKRKTVQTDRQQRITPTNSSDTAISAPSAAPQGKQSASSQTAQLATTAVERQHLIAPGDAVSLLVFGEPDLSVENVRVPQSGQVSFPLIGPVVVAGKTTSEVEQSVAKLLSQGYVRNPRLSVTIFSYRPIFIRGGVNATGAFPYTEGLTIAKAIALAGGSKNSAKLNGVSILRDGNTAAEGLSVDSQFEVASGDVITVAEDLGVSGDQTSYIYIHGEVARPGEYAFRRGLTVEKAIVLASGFTLRASKRKIDITRYVGVEENQPPERLKRVKLYAPIEPGDVINVGASWF